MGAPKQKWTSEEEAALKAGVTKYGAGKWSTILKDPEFSILLYSRSNVDLKDKWRNMNVAANGWGSRSRVRVASKSNQQIVKDDDKALSTVSQSDTDIVDAQPLAGSNGTSENASSKKPIPRLDNLILEAITNLKEPRGSSRAAIAIYIEERYLAPENLERLLAATLKLLTENGKLVKVKHQFRIAPPSIHTDVKKDSSPSLLEGKQKNSPKVDKNEIKILSKSQIDAELEKMKGMTAQEAAAAAALAVAEAEAAIAEAEEAAREAEKAEAEAEAAQLFAEAAMKALKCRTVCT
ncbi:telomere repeat-binding factor 1-like [Actinidia eriantha]|uniref:telomere repeat-binding factor 1-like n=1 Tax=Actinidia eriantha TaxID=165200 RepID=UPI002585CE99|nr:telomere repeat-binding factor 1-like [Actinidia eriantha]XP_057491692.1 telomere repeat-binding factor 1-like [Actinidia eriantha]